MCVGHAGNHTGVEVTLLAGSGLGRDVRLVHGLVRQHGLADHIADCEDVWHVGAHLAINGDEATIGHRDAGLVSANLLAVRAASGGLQNHVVALSLFRRLVALESYPKPIIFGRNRSGLGFKHDLLETLTVLLLPYLDQIAVRPLHQAVEHFHHIHLGTQCGIHRGHFQTNDAAADDQQFLGYETQFQRTGGIDDAGIAGDERQMHGGTAGGNDALLETDDFLGTSFFLRLARGFFHFEVIGIEEVTIPAHCFDLARLGHTSKSASELADHLGLVCPQLVDIDGWRSETDAKVTGVLGFFHDGGNMQQRFGGNTADVQAHAT